MSDLLDRGVTPNRSSSTPKTQSSTPEWGHASLPPPTRSVKNLTEFTSGSTPEWGHASRNLRSSTTEWGHAVKQTIL